ncbi:hypothetical protein PVAND_006111 [Polypedilum vanderplanki]|uniref:Uncharacterized protein n=1 Tax=Polypedilum vanderplanki TaxID=319348 RepID=A0A9J6C2K5_POLVA|nr:hypothetical protein PVAND_006111 [Polypedilum vanderplanki]
MDHNGFYAELDSLTNIGTSISNSFNVDHKLLDIALLNNYKYPQSTSNIYQQQTIPDLNHHSIKSTSSSTALHITQIHINNCNNNIFFPTRRWAGQNNNNFIGYIRKEAGPNSGGVGGINNSSNSGDSNITYNINNINTNIVIISTIPTNWSTQVATFLVVINIIR